MGTRTGSADLPLHGGRVPEWLAGRMARLGRVIVEAIVLDYGRQEVLRRLAHPFWFQCFGAVMGMDWHSSGITTSVIGALRRGLADVEWDLGLHVCGGRGRHSRQTPTELVALGERLGFDGASLARQSRLVAKVDSAAVQDGFDLYLHGFIVTDDGNWAVVQQGMNTDRLKARRYHWLSEGLRSFVEEPHAAIDGEPGGEIINLTDRRAARARAVEVAMAAGGPGPVLAALRDLQPAPAPAVAPQPRELALPYLQLPAHHEVRASDVFLRRLHGTLAAAAERGPRDFADLLLTPGVGARTVAALAAVAEVIHGAPSRFADPARYSLAHGGKDGHPFPVPLAVYDRTLGTLREAVGRARLGNDDRLAAIRRLDQEARRLESGAGPAFDAFVGTERDRSHEWGGMTVMGPARPPRRARPARPPAPGRAARGPEAAPAQLELPGVPRG
jgi:uncharacterized protein